MALSDTWNWFKSWFTREGWIKYDPADPATPAEILAGDVWYAIVRELDGKLVSLATVLPQEIPGHEAKELPEKPDLNAVMWDETTASFVARPAKVLVDRWEELKVHTDYSEGWGKVSLADKTDMEKAILEMLGTKRFRNQADLFGIDTTLYVGG
jgi:hypothetical protein